MNRYLEEELVSILVRPEIYSNVKDNETKNKTHVDTDYEWEKMAPALISTLFYYQILW